ncbi:hypothetical protein AHF37_00647 [Paragonimus kellicotti]|nr:hypothetical protein AHF37_00647 [Paragonimus kellicotti]
MQPSERLLTDFPSLLAETVEIKWSALRTGLQGFIFSAKPSSGDETLLEAESRPITLGNTRARAVMEKIHQKLTGTEREKAMDVSNQVNYLIREATSNQNLCQMYIGWCAFW